ncbi:hypothetical protein D3C85_1108720 [compost metagenome]
MITLGEIGELVIGVTTAILQSGAGLDVIVERSVVPGGGAQAEAILALIAEIEFAEQVDAIGHHVMAVESVITFVRVGASGNGVVRRLHAPSGVVAQRVAPLHADIGIARIDFEGLHRSRCPIERQHGRSKLRREARLLFAYSHL